MELVQGNRVRQRKASVDLLTPEGYQVMKTFAPHDTPGVSLSTWAAFLSAIFSRTIELTEAGMMIAEYNKRLAEEYVL